MVRLTRKAKVLIGHHSSARRTRSCWKLSLRTQLCPVKRSLLGPKKKHSGPVCTLGPLGHLPQYLCKRSLLASKHCICKETLRPSARHGMSAQRSCAYWRPQSTQAALEPNLRLGGLLLPGGTRHRRRRWGCRASIRLLLRVLRRVLPLRLWVLWLGILLRWVLGLPTPGPSPRHFPVLCFHRPFDKLPVAVRRRSLMIRPAAFLAMTLLVFARRSRSCRQAQSASH